MSIISGSLTPTGGLVAVNIDDLCSLILDPAAFNASGSTLSTTGTINLGGTTLHLDTSLDFEAGQGIYVSLNTSTAPFITTIATVITPQTLVLAGTAPANYAGAIIRHDDAIALNAAITNGYGSLISSESKGYYQVNGGGRPYNVSGPLTQQSGLVLENFKLIALDSSFWVSGTLASGTFGVGPTSNGVIYNPSAYSVVCRDIFIDLATLAVNGLVNYSPAGVKYENCRVDHWGGAPTETTAGIGLYNAGKCTASDCNFIQWNESDLEAKKPSSNNSGYALYCDNVVTTKSGDSLFHNCNFNSGLRPVYIAENVNYIRFSDCHTWPCWDSADVGFTLSNPANFEIHGSNIVIDDHYLDSGYILIVQQTASPDIKIDIGQCVYQETLTSYSAHVLVTTTIANAHGGNIFISPDNLLAGGVPELKFEASGTGSFNIFSSAVQSAALAGQQKNLMTTNGGLLVADLSTTSDVATLMGNSTTATWLSFIDSGTTASVTPQVGSEGNDILLRYDGTVAFRGSAGNGCAILGKSPNTLTVTTAAAIYSNQTTTSLSFIDSASTMSSYPQVSSEGNDIVLSYAWSNPLELIHL